MTLSFAIPQLPTSLKPPLTNPHNHTCQLSTSKTSSPAPPLLAPTNPSKPLENIQTLDNQLRQFSLNHNLPQNELPRLHDLLQSHRADLINAIWHHHGGFHNYYQTRTNLHRKNHCHTKRQSRYTSWESLKEDIVKFIDERARFLDLKNAGVIRRYMPRQVDFVEKGRNDLVWAIRFYGGMKVVAKKMGLLMNYHAGVDYKGEFERLVDEIGRFVEIEGGVGVGKGLFPTAEMMRRCGRLDLVVGIRNHGGVGVVAGKMGLKVQKGALAAKERKRNPEWLKRELGSVSKGFMPTNAELIDRGRLDLLRTVKNLGGRVIVAEMLGIEIDDGTFLSEDIFEQEVCHSKAALDYNLGNDLQRKATDSIPIRGGGGGSILGREGGRRREAYRFQDFERLKDELMCFIFDDGQMGVMPTRTELLRAGRGDLLRAMAVHGGQKLVAKRLRLVRNGEGRVRARKRAMIVDYS